VQRASRCARTARRSRSRTRRRGRARKLVGCGPQLGHGDTRAWLDELDEAVDRDDAIEIDGQLVIAILDEIQRRQAEPLARARIARTRAGPSTAVTLAMSSRTGSTMPRANTTRPVRIRGTRGNRSSGEMRNASVGLLELHAARNRYGPSEPS